MIGDQNVIEVIGGFFISTREVRQERHPGLREFNPHLGPDIAPADNAGEDRED